MNNPRNIISFCLLFVISFSANSQRFMDKAGHASFFSKAPLENIEAHNRQALSILDLKSGDIAVTVLMKSFQFEKALMQEHFNENYVESDKYPKASFKGKIAGIEKVDLSKDAVHTLDVSGEITVHGETKPVQTKAELTVSKGNLSGKSSFTLPVKDFKIEIPKIVVNNIAETVDVKVEFQYQPAK
jgi:polyisoprenoid-binding protein YceI